MSGKNYNDPLLSNLAKGYRPFGHINEMILPSYPVKLPTAKIGVYGGENLRIVTTIKAAEGTTPVVTSNITQATAYTLEEHALKAMASDKEKENQEKPFDVRRDKMELVMDLLSVSREYGLANYMNDDANFTNSTTLSGTAQWGGSADDPIGDIATAVGTVADAVNVPDEKVSLVMSMPVWRIFRTLDEVKDLLGFKYNQTKVLQPQQIAEALGVKQLLLARGRYNSAEDGQTDVFANLWGNHCWAGYFADSPKIKDVPFGYTPRRKAALVVDRWRDEDIKGEWIRCTDEYDQYIIEEKALYMIDAAVA